MRRVVVTGIGMISSLGQNWGDISDRLQVTQNGICAMPEWQKYKGLRTRLAGPVLDFRKPNYYPRKATRSMGKVALMAVRASEVALEEAGLLQSATLINGRTGVSFGSSTGSPTAVADFGNMLANKSTAGLNATSYIRMMSHTTPVNIGIFFGLTGRVYTTSSACTSGSQGIGSGYEAIAYGLQDVMICGGAEELCASEAAVFDVLFATSTQNHSPELSPRPFDKDRDGLVVGEGAATLVLEELEHARERGANILGEILGYATNSDGAHVTRPDPRSMATVMELALKNAGCNAADIQYVSAHGTATDHGDFVESQATHKVLGPNVPVSALKSYTGHTLGACGAMEALVTLKMMREGWFHPTLNLEHPDPSCAPLDHIRGDGRHLNCEIALSNNFAFGGINTSLVLGRTV